MYICRLIRQVGHKLKQIGALTHPMRAEKDRDVIEAAHTLTRVEEVLEDCFSALENYTGKPNLLISILYVIFQNGFQLKQFLKKMTTVSELDSCHQSLMVDVITIIHYYRK